MGSKNPLHWGLQHGQVQHLYAAPLARERLAPASEQWPASGKAAMNTQVSPALFPFPPCFYGIPKEAKRGRQRREDSLSDFWVVLLCRSLWSHAGSLHAGQVSEGPLL